MSGLELDQDLTNVWPWCDYDVSQTFSSISTPVPVHHQMAMIWPPYDRVLTRYNMYMQICIHKMIWFQLESLLLLENYTQNFNLALWQNDIVAISDHFHRTYHKWVLIMLLHWEIRGLFL